MIPDKDDQPTVKVQPPKTLVQFFYESPLVGVELDLERDKDPGRDIAMSAAARRPSSV